MMISTKGRYALRLMIDLAQHNTGDCVPLKEITRRQGIAENSWRPLWPYWSRVG